MCIHVLVAGHGGAIVKILDVEGTKPGVWRGDGAVEENCFGCEAGCLGGRWSGKIETVPAGAVANTTSFSLGWANGGFLLAIGDFAPGRHFMFVDKNRCRCRQCVVLGPALANALRESAQVVGHAAEPQFAVGAVEHNSIVHSLAGGGVDDGVSFGRWGDMRRPGGTSSGGDVGGSVQGYDSGDGGRAQPWGAWSTPRRWVR
jgi:hypothetical protein